MIMTNRCDKHHADCKFGLACSEWQYHKCAFIHDMKAMRCSKCDGAHRAINCTKKNDPTKSESKEKEYPRYNGTDYFTSKVKPKSEENRFAPPQAASVTPRKDKVLALRTKRLRMNDGEKDSQLNVSLTIVHP